MLREISQEELEIMEKRVLDAMTTLCAVHAEIQKYKLREPPKEKTDEPRDL